MSESFDIFLTASDIKAFNILTIVFRDFTLLKMHEIISRNEMLTKTEEFQVLLK